MSKHNPYYFIVKDNKVWVKNLNCNDYSNPKEEPYYLAFIQSFDNIKQEALIKYIHNKSTESVKFTSLLPFLQEVNIDEENLAMKTEVNEMDLNNNLKNRFYKNKIFTYVSNTLLVLNPYKVIDNCFDDIVMERYFEMFFPKYSGIINSNVKGKSKLSITGLSNNEDIISDNPTQPPHIYQIVFSAIKELFTSDKNQTIIISGESGAGKTESSKYALRCVSYFFNKNRISKSMEKTILSINPILEAFGNAKTLRNDNSSRFGKYIKLNIFNSSTNYAQNINDMHNKNYSFMSTAFISGCEIETFLLEKSRVVTPGKGERNFHIFYQLLSGAPENLLEQINLISSDNRNPEEYIYLRESECYDIDNLNEQKAFKETLESLTLFFRDDEIMMIWRILASCLLLGNIEFIEDNAFSNNKINLNPESNLTLTNVCKMLGLNKSAFEECMTMVTRKIGDQVIKSPLKLYECIQIKNSIAKELYSRMFNYIVKRLNSILNNNSNSSNTNIKHIGILDIFGFESFELNSFEQFCINYSNERLHQLYIKDIFLAEQAIYEKEGIEDIKFNFTDNQQIIDLIDKKGSGIFQILDDACLTKNDGRYFFINLSKVNSNNSKLVINKLSNQVFAIKHTPKTVEYEIDGFIAKNVDEVKQLALEIFINSESKVLQKIFTCSLNEEELNVNKEELRDKLDPKKSTKIVIDKKFLGTKFRFEIEELVSKIKLNKSHYIRCIKPNNMKEKNLFVSSLVLQQIQYLGVLDVIKLKSKGYPIKKNYYEFLDHFGRIYKEFDLSNLSTNDFSIPSDLKQIISKEDKENISAKCRSLALKCKNKIEKQVTQIRKTQSSVYKYAMKALEVMNQKDQPNMILSLKEKKFESKTSLHSISMLSNKTKNLTNNIINQSLISKKFIDINTPTNDLVFNNNNNDELTFLTGNTIIFMKTQYYNELNKMSDELICFQNIASEKIKSLILAYNNKKKFYLQKRASIILQNFFRDKQPMIHFKKLRNYTIRIQSNWKALLTRFSFLLMKEKVIQIQTIFRRFNIRKLLLLKQECAVVINRKIKQYLYWKRFQDVLFCKRYIISLFESSWKQHQFNLKVKKIISIQTKIRYVQARSRNMGIIIKAQNKRLWFIRNKNAIKIQALYKRGIGRMLYKLKKIFSVKIQTAFRCFLKRRIFLALRNSSLIIQNMYLTYYRSKKAIRKVLKKYIEEYNKPLFISFLRDYFTLFPHSSLKKRLFPSKYEVSIDEFINSLNSPNSNLFNNMLDGNYISNSKFIDIIENQLDAEELNMSPSTNYNNYNNPSNVGILGSNNTRNNYNNAINSSQKSLKSIKEAEAKKLSGKVNSNASELKSNKKIDKTTINNNNVNNSYVSNSNKLNKQISYNSNLNKSVVKNNYNNQTINNISHNKEFIQAHNTLNYSNNADIQMALTLHKIQQIQEKMRPKKKTFAFDEYEEDDNEAMLNKNSSNYINSNFNINTSQLKQQPNLFGSYNIQSTLISNLSGQIKTTSESFVNRLNYWDESVFIQQELKKKEQLLIEKSLCLPDNKNYLQPKITLFTKVLTYDSCISTLETGNKQLITNFSKIEKENLSNNTPIMKISLSDYHACCINSIGRAYVFGLNHFNQSGSSVEETYLKNYDCSGKEYPNKENTHDAHYADTYTDDKINKEDSQNDGDYDNEADINEQYSKYSNNKLKHTFHEDNQIENNNNRNINSKNNISSNNTLSMTINNPDTNFNIINENSLNYYMTKKDYLGDSLKTKTETIKTLTSRPLTTTYLNKNEQIIQRNKIVILDNSNNSNVSEKERIHYSDNQYYVADNKSSQAYSNKITSSNAVNPKYQNINHSDKSNKELKGISNSNDINNLLNTYDLATKDEDKYYTTKSNKSKIKETNKRNNNNNNNNQILYNNNTNTNSLSRNNDVHFNQLNINNFVTNTKKTNINSNVPNTSNNPNTTENTIKYETIQKHNINKKYPLIDGKHFKYNLNLLEKNITSSNPIATSISVYKGIKKAVLTKEQTFLLNNENNIIAFGNNASGELGLGYKSLDSSPQVIDSNLIANKVKDFNSSGNFIFVLTEKQTKVQAVKNNSIYKNNANNSIKSNSNETHIYAWSLKESKNISKQNSPLLLELPSLNIKITSIACGGNFTILLSNNGLVYSFGTSNSHGELGQAKDNEYSPLSKQAFQVYKTPTLIETLAYNGIKIVQISCGFKHVIIKSSNFKVFGWGNNSHSQLGIEKPNKIPFPYEISFISAYPTLNHKIYQVAAGYQSSYFLDEKRHVLFCGKINFFKAVVPQKLNISENTPELSNESRFSILKISCSWNRMVSLFYATIADLKCLYDSDVKMSEINGLVNTIANKWDTDNAYLPNLGKFSNYNKFFHFESLSKE